MLTAKELFERKGYQLITKDNYIIKYLKLREVVVLFNLVEKNYSVLAYKGDLEEIKNAIDRQLIELGWLEKNAEKMFKKLGFTIRNENDKTLVYYNFGKKIGDMEELKFDKLEKTVLYTACEGTFICETPARYNKAIKQQMKELGWLE